MKATVAYFYDEKQKNLTSWLQLQEQNYELQHITVDGKRYHTDKQDAPLPFWGYFASAAVAADSSCVTAPSSASGSRFSPPSNFVKSARVDSVVHGLLLATITGRWMGETAFVQVIGYFISRVL